MEQFKGNGLGDIQTKKALLHFGLSNIQQKKKYKAIADKLNFIPYKKKKNGELTNTPLKDTSPTYKKAVEAELLKRYGKWKETHEEQIQLLKNMAEQMKAKPENLKIKINKKKPPSIAYSEPIKKFGRYEKHYFKTENVKDLRDLYEMIKQADIKLGGGTYATLIIVSSLDDKVRRISITENYLDNFEDFEGRINQISKGDLVGSDAIDENTSSLILDSFHLSRLPIVEVLGASNGILFKCLEINSKDNLCGYECLKACGFDFDELEKEVKPYELRKIDKLVEVVRKHYLPIRIICNGIQLRKTIYQIMNDEHKLATKEKMLFNTKTRKDEMRWINKLNDDEFLTVNYPLYGEERKDNVYTIIYDDLGKHCDVCLNYEPELKDELRISLKMELLINNEVIMTAKQCNKNALDTTKFEFKYIFFDYETVMNFKLSSCMMPYSLSILILNEAELSTLEEADMKKDVETVKKIRQKNCMTFLGYDCSDKFLRWFFKNTDNLCYCFVGFNNTNFDNFILLDALLNFDMEANKTEFSVGDVFYNGSQLLNFKIDKRHSFFDIRKHLVGSLKANCEAFKINCCAKKSFEHSKAQRLHEDGKLIEFITDNDELKEYNEYDVLATAVLFKKYQKALLDIPSTVKYAENLKDTITIGSLIYKVFTEHIRKIKEDNIKNMRAIENKKSGKISPEFEKKLKAEFDKDFFGKLSYTFYKDLQKYKIAGRVELFNGIMEIFERMASTDVCSLYPFVMAVLNVYYPYGEIKEVSHYQGDDRIGFYYCDIDQSNLRKDNKPKIYARKTKTENDWNFSDDVILKDNLISNVMIGLLLKHGCKVDIKNGFVFEKKMKSCKMFKFILEMMEAKNKQDVYKDSNDPVEREKYIAPLRETLKLLQNSLSGKVIEGLHTEKTKDCANCADYDIIRADPKTKAINFIDAVGGKLFVTYEIDEETLCEKEQRPIFLGVLIYDYAKRYMYEYSYSKIGLDKLYYTDTDASKFKYKDMALWRKWIETEKIVVPHWEEVEAVDARYKTHLIYNPHSKVYGSFEDELDGMIGEKYAFYCLEKKSWAYAVLNDDGSINQKKNKKTGLMDNNSKFKFKGINGQAIILNGDEDFIEEIKINHKKDNTTEIKKKIKEGYEKTVYEYAENNKHKAIEAGNEISFFKNLYDTKEAYVLTNSFRKIVKNSAHNVAFGDDDKYNKLFNKIQVNYVMKHITLKDKEPFKEPVETAEDDVEII